MNPSATALQSRHNACEHGSVSHSQTQQANKQGESYSTSSSFTEKVELHRGRYSTVWSAKCINTGRTVVLKAYAKQKMKARQLMQARREVSLLTLFQQMGYDGVVALLSSYEDSEAIHLVFEACMRGDLYQMLVKKRGTLPEEYVAFKVVVPLLRVLVQLHKLNIVHRDIKPENIFVTAEEDIKLGDFGLAAQKFNDNLTERVGTLDYMAPEVLALPTPDEIRKAKEAPFSTLNTSSQAATAPSAHISTAHEGCSDTSDPKGKQTKSQGPDTASKPNLAKIRTASYKLRAILTPYDEKVDVWAVGILVYELLLGKPPFEVEDRSETAKLIMLAQIPEISNHLSKDCCNFISLCLTQDPKSRPSAKELLSHPWVKKYASSRTCHGSDEGISLKSIRAWFQSGWGRTSFNGNRMTGRVLADADADMLLHASGCPRRALSNGDDPFLFDRDFLLRPSPATTAASTPRASPLASPVKSPATGRCPNIPKSPSAWRQAMQQLPLGSACGSSTSSGTARKLFPASEQQQSDGPSLFTWQASQDTQVTHAEQHSLGLAAQAVRSTSDASAVSLPDLGDLRLDSSFTSACTQAPSCFSRDASATCFQPVRSTCGDTSLQLSPTEEHVALSHRSESAHDMSGTSSAPDCSGLQAWQSKSFTAAKKSTSRSRFAN